MLTKRLNAPHPRYSFRARLSGFLFGIEQLRPDGGGQQLVTAEKREHHGQHGRHHRGRAYPQPGLPLGVPRQPLHHLEHPGPCPQADHHHPPHPQPRRRRRFADGADAVLHRLLSDEERVSSLVGRRTVTWTLALTWALVALASVPAVIFRDVRTSADRAICDSYHDEDSHTIVQYMLELVLGFLIPYSVVAVSYIWILCRIRQTKFRRRIRSEKLILAIVVTFCLFWLPYHMVNMVQVTWALCPEGSVKATLAKIWHRSRAVTSSVAFISSCANPVLYFFAGKSYIRREGLAFMARLFEAAGLDSVTRKSRQNSQNSRDKDKEMDGIVLKESNSSSAVKALKPQT
ncbi:leukotriene B4 receptor 1-like isoform X3 [Syngnathoides biaculeatus]|uniref:leukotriene B4 receptor 1-like isoform X3 n=1 Tax=Syngnathoides biaculeatus TaxID=300417 RepID=UPI002ADD3A55|nr:leukotriene B4 receptor 1-like isoform X3 [Syngnathoides biaculeatus]